MYIIQLDGAAQLLAINAYSFELDNINNALVFRNEKGEIIGYHDRHGVRSVFKNDTPKIYPNNEQERK